MIPVSIGFHSNLVNYHIPLKSKYVPKKGDVVIGKIKDVRFSMWDVDINSPYSGILPAFEVFGREKKELELLA